MTILWRYAQEPSASGDLSKFPDADNESLWAADPLKWAVGTGIISGDERGYVNPGNSAVRAELAAVLQRYGEKQDN